MPWTPNFTCDWGALEKQTTCDRESEIIGCTAKTVKTFVMCPYLHFSVHTLASLLDVLSTFTPRKPKAAEQFSLFAISGRFSRLHLPTLAQLVSSLSLRDFLRPLMDLRKLVVPDHFSSAFSSKGKVVSGFGVVFLASLLVFSVISLRGLDSSRFSWFFPVPSTSVSAALPPAAELQKSMEPWQIREEEEGNVKSSRGNSSEKEDERIYVRKKDVILQRTQEGDIPEVGKVAGFTSFGVGQRVTERSHGGKKDILKENGDEISFNKDKEGMVEKAQERENDKNGSHSLIKEKVAEKNRKGNISGKDKNATFPAKEERIEERAQTGILSEKDKLAFLSNGSDSLKRVSGFSEKCDIYNGRWVRDEGKPYYPPGSCPHIDKDFNCYENGRPDDEFVRWRWQPKDCDIPSLNATDFLERLRGKNLLFVGDSLNRNMWESLVCILRHSVVNKSRVHEAFGRSKFKTKGYYSVVYEDYNCSVDFVRSPFLVKETWSNGGNGEEEILHLDLMDELTRVCQEADVLVFNTGHWWTHEKTSRGENYYQEGDHVYPKLNVKEAYKKALTTWATWIDKNFDANRTRVFFRGYSVSHFSGGQWNSAGQCKSETEPIFNEAYLGKYPWKMKTLEKVLGQMQTPIVYMNISRLTDYRKDGHPSIYRKEYKTDQHTQDCSHWCLPGVPDTWNELLYASLVMAS